MERMKVCSRCELNLPESEFSRDRTKKDGRHHCCKTCDSVKYRLFYLANAEVLNQRKAEYRAARRDERNAAQHKQRERRRQGVPPREPRYLAEIPAD